MNAISTILSPFDLKLRDHHDGQRRNALEATTSALAYLIREFEINGQIDRINMAHAYSAEALGQAVLSLDQAQREAGR